LTIARNINERFFEKVRHDASGCWLWEAGLTDHGYGTFRLGGRSDGKIYAHIYTYELLIGRVPDGLELDHLCRTPSCCNPWHLEPVTHRINSLRGISPTILMHRANLCKRGHSLLGDNAYVRPSGERNCRICLRMRKSIVWKTRTREELV